MEVSVEHALGLLMEKLDTMAIGNKRKYFYNLLGKHLLEYSHKGGRPLYSHQLGLEYLRDYEGATLQNAHGADKFRFIHMITDVLEGREIPRSYGLRRKFKESPLQEKNLLDSYRHHLCKIGRAGSSIIAMVSRVKQFLQYLDEKSLAVREITIATVDEFTESISARYTSNAKSNILFSLRNFFSYLEGEAILPTGASSMVGRIVTHKHERLASFYSKEEVIKILDCVDITTPVGKRDYAILVLAAQLGLRISDICRLTPDCIDFEKRIVSYAQKKTGVMRVLPLSELATIALADYIANARPITEHKEVFVTLNAYGENTVCAGTSYQMLNKYMRRAGIDTKGKRHGMHALRHSLASSLLREHNPLPVISAVLGHSSTEITSQYLWMAPERLRPLALEVPPWT